LSDRHDRALIAFVNALSGINHPDTLSASRWLHSPAGRAHVTEWFGELNATPGMPQDGTTDYGMAEADTPALDRACTEEWMRRALTLATGLYEYASEGNADPVIQDHGTDDPDLQARHPPRRHRRLQHHRRHSTMNDTTIPGGFTDSPLF
jgi:hypothetical protein